MPTAGASARGRPDDGRPRPATLAYRGYLPPVLGICGSVVPGSLRFGTWFWVGGMPVWLPGVPVWPLFGVDPMLSCEPMLPWLRWAGSVSPAGGTWPGGTGVLGGTAEPSFGVFDGEVLDGWPVSGVDCACAPPAIAPITAMAAAQVSSSRFM